MNEKKGKTMKINSQNIEQGVARACIVVPTNPATPCNKSENGEKYLRVLLEIGTNVK
jgi:hypothetical protein